MAAPPEHQTVGSAGAEISNGLVQLIHEYTGRGPTGARTTISEESVMVLLRDVLTRAERRLAEDGEADTVLSIRGKFQQTMREDMVAVVERVTGRQVAAFMSANHIDPDMACEIFVLEPAGSGKDVPAAA
ncbi:MAG TPA: Na-translocating system protein MpsC family protein [Thermoleophilaceae bacterium]|nr:Na-translocating system protein MpsC family protein [Thermoleophilaceae bacterium]